MLIRSNLGYHASGDEPSVYGGLISEFNESQICLVRHHILPPPGVGWQRLIQVLRSRSRIPITVLLVDYAPQFSWWGPLPVSLSSFCQVRDKATGAVVIWCMTESELDNAGHNILRSEKKDGEFKVVNLKSIIPDTVRLPRSRLRMD